MFQRRKMANSPSIAWHFPHLHPLLWVPNLRLWSICLLITGITEISSLLLSFCGRNPDCIFLIMHANSLQRMLGEYQACHFMFQPYRFPALLSAINDINIKSKPQWDNSIWCEDPLVARGSLHWVWTFQWVGFQVCFPSLPAETKPRWGI